MREKKKRILGFMPSRKPAGSESGFTIVELLTVVALIGLLAGIAIPNIAKMVARGRLRSTAGDFAKEIQIARLKAISKNQTCAVIVNPHADSPGGNYLVCCSGDPPVYPSGSLSAPQAIKGFYYKSLGGDYAKSINIQTITGAEEFSTALYCPVDVINTFGLPTNSKGILVNNFGRVLNLNAAAAQVSLRRFAGTTAKGSRTVTVSDSAKATVGSEREY